jgi:hypothetical protein
LLRVVASVESAAKCSFDHQQRFPAKGLSQNLPCFANELFLMFRNGDGKFVQYPLLTSTQKEKNRDNDPIGSFPQVRSATVSDIVRL